MGVAIPNRRDFDDIRIMSNDLVERVRFYHQFVVTCRGELSPSLNDDDRNTLHALCNAMRIMCHHVEQAQTAIEQFHKSKYHAT